jgi:5-enolpyruvylshikimate-3-phosphate synthase
VTEAIQQLCVEPCSRPLVGRVPVFDDQDILLVRIALGVVCRGRTRIDLHQEPGPAARVFLRALALLGVQSETRKAPDGSHELDVHGRGLLAELDNPGLLDVRGASDVAGLLVGLLAGRPGNYDLLVDERVADAMASFLVPLGALRVEREDGGFCLRLRWQADARLPGFEIDSLGYFSWHKQAALLIGLRSAGEIRVFEQVASSDHLERALARARAPLERMASLLVLHPPRDADALSPDHFHPIGSARALGYLAAAALSVPGSRIEVRGVSTNQSGPDVPSIVHLLGGGVSVRPQGDVHGEPVGDVTFFGQLGLADSLRPLVVAGESAVRLGDSVLPLIVAAARGRGRFEFPEIVPHGRAGDPRIIERLVGLLRSGGMTVDLDSGVTLVGQGSQPVVPLRMTTGGDGRLAALGTLMAMAGGLQSIIDDVDCLREEFPRLIGTLRALGARLETRTV